MNVVFLHNLQTAPTAEQAEFDTPETVQVIRQALEELGHRVTLLDAASSVSQLVERLESAAPDLVFNTAEGVRGRSRGAFYPALLEQNGLAFTGSDAYVCNLTLDKNLTKLLLASHGLTTPGWRFVTSLDQTINHGLRFPLMVKPNYEGSSKGITQDSVVPDQAVLESRLKQVLKTHPDGVLIEEFIEGMDVTVPWLESKGVLEPASYTFATSERAHQIYDYELKQHQSHLVEVVCPALISASTRKQVLSDTARIVKVLGLRDLGRVDYRVDSQGRAYLIEVNALPSLEPGASLYQAAATKGLKTVAQVLEAIVKSARQRVPKPSSKRTAKPRVALIYNLKRRKGAEVEAEFDSSETIEALLQAISELGYEAFGLEATPDLPSRLEGIDLVFNIAEGLRGRNRESQVPALLELLDIPFTGSDAGALAVTLDKALAKRLVRMAGVATADFAVMNSPRDKLPTTLTYPLFVKPVAEGSSKGILEDCLVERPEQLKGAVTRVLDTFHQPALVETFLSGREFTVGLLGTRRLRLLPPMEILFGDGNQRRLYGFEHKQSDHPEIGFQVPAELDPALYRQLEKAAKTAYRALGCRDVARLDFRLDAQDKVHFIECNPLPGLSPGFSDLCVIAEAAGMTYRDLVAEILNPAVRRWKQTRKEQRSLALA